MRDLIRRSTPATWLMRGGVAAAVFVAVVLLMPGQAHAWGYWGHPGWGWHHGWGWHPGWGWHRPWGWHPGWGYGGGFWVPGHWNGPFWVPGHWA